MRGPGLLVLALAVLGCTEKKAEPLKSLAPKPLPSLEVEPTYRVEPAPVYGEELPPGARQLAFDGSAAPDLSALTPESVVLLSPSPEVYLAQAAELLARLDDSDATVYLAHPEGKVSYRLTLRDEPHFRAWLDEPKPGQVRIIQRQDGFELQTNVGKLPGVDPNGPTVPLRGGQADLATLRRGLSQLKERFTVTPDICFVPSFGTELSKVAAAMSADYAEAGEPIFGELCLVYPRPSARDH
ncbi:MAG: hypothetical protein ACYC8T_03130 [Myxococcaceae bacterium]